MDKPPKTMAQAKDYLQHQNLVIEEQSGCAQQPKQHAETWLPLSTVKLLTRNSSKYQIRFFEQGRT